MLQPTVRSARPRALRPRYLAGVVLTAVLAVASVGCGTGPGQPTTGLGSDTPCGRSDVQLSNPSSPADPIYVAYPTGTPSAPLTGGTCGDSARPVVFLVHGWLANSNALYEGVINHFTATGNIVVMGTYQTDINDVQGSANRALAAITAAVPQLTRANVDRVGLIGHSLGGGMLPWVTQQVASRGWGDTDLWAFLLAPYRGIGTGTITLPSHTRVVVEAYDNDTLVDNAVGIDLFHRMSIPNSQKDHVTVRSSSHGSESINAQHTSPNSIISPDDAVKFYGIYRVGDVLQSCALQGTNCSADLSYMGVWADRTPVLPSVVSDDPDPL
jgi:hypothetical protein